VFGLKRRDFITLLGGTAVAWPFAVRAQQPDRPRRVGVLTPVGENDQEGRSRVAAFRAGLRDLGWTEGGNLHVDYRWAAGDAGRIRAYATELVRLKPDVILANSTPVVAALRGETRSIPIVFSGVSDPIGIGLVESLARPGGHITGFANFEPSIGGKWLEVLKELATDVRRVVFLFNPRNASWVRIFEEIKAASSLLDVEPIAAGVRDVAEIEKAIDGLAGQPNTGLIVQPDAITTARRQVIVDLVRKHRVPAVYPIRAFATDGGLMVYGVDIVDQFRRAASYVDRILKGTKPADLPVQAPSKFELVINLKTAKALGLEVPPALLARADEVIE
jgi:putative ABC transport system substrate-binding protein